MDVRQISAAVAEVRIPIASRTNWEQWFLLTSDHHWDNPKCKWDLLERHLNQARERDARVFVFGDLLCMMQGKYDKRANKSSVRPEHQVDNYIDAVIETAAEWYGRYADLFAVISEGNHESAIRKNHETDVLTRLVERINTLQGTRIIRGGYGGWVKFRFNRDQQRQSRNLKYFHGAGGGGPVTRGVIQTNRQAVYLPDADFVVNGHVHESYMVTIPRERISQNGRLHIDRQTHLRCATYKEEYADGTSGWHIERGGPPKPLGGWWLRFYWDGERGLRCDCIEAN
jgi:hypothetical protein